MQGRPSPAFGLRRVSGMWRLVLAVWLVAMAVFVPVRLVLWTAVGETLGALPAGDLPDGELLLIVFELLQPVWLALAVAALSGWIALWAWTVLWHAGLVRWLFFAGRVEFRLAEVLGHGLMGWWRWARLGLTSLSVLLITHSALWLAVQKAKEHARVSADDSLLGYGLLIAFSTSVVVLVLCWLATLRGSWLLGAGNRRSAVLGWFTGLWGSVRQPVSSLVTLTLWSVPAVAATIVPILVGWNFEALRSPLPSAIIDAACGLLAAFCLVGLFLSFAPVTGLVGEQGEE